MLFALRLKKHMHVDVTLSRFSKLLVNNYCLIKVNNLGVLKVRNKRVLLVSLDGSDNLKDSNLLEIVSNAYDLLKFNVESIEQFVTLSVHIKIKKCKYGENLLKGFIANYNEKYKNINSSEDALTISHIDYSDFKDSVTYTLKITLDEVRNIEHLSNLVDDLDSSTYVSRVTL